MVKHLTHRTNMLKGQMQIFRLKYNQMSKFDRHFTACPIYAGLLAFSISLAGISLPSPLIAAPDKTRLQAPSPRTGLPRQRKVFKEIGGRSVPSIISTDFNGDGRFDFEQRYHESGQWVALERSDLDGNGTWDVSSLYQWNRDKRRAVLTEEQFDTNYDGIPDLWKIYRPDGQLKTRKLDRSLSGEADYWEHYSNNQIVRIEKDEDNDGDPDRVPVPRIKR